MVDGLGMLHPRRCGSASHVGLAADQATIGVAKNPFHWEGSSLDYRPAEHSPAQDTQKAGEDVRLWTCIRPVCASLRCSGQRC